MKCTHGRGASCHHCILKHYGGYFAIPEESRLSGYEADKMQESIEQYLEAMRILGDDFDLDIDVMHDEMGAAGYSWQYLRDDNGDFYGSWECGDPELCG